MNTSPLFHRFAETLVLLAASIALAIPTVVHAQETPQHIAVTLADYRFTPAHLTVHKGQPVTLTLTNKDGMTPHNFTLQDKDGGLDIDTDIGAGKSVVVEFTPKVSGIYTFYCNKKLPLMKSHHARGMEGTLTVQ